MCLIVFDIGQGVHYLDGKCIETGDANMLSDREIIEKIKDVLLINADKTNLNEVYDQLWRIVWRR
jgi:hypothetical protein